MSYQTLTQKIEGTVKFFQDRRGYGFIQRDGGSDSDDVFFHREDVGEPDLEEGQRVRFEISESQKGPRAKNVERI